MGLLTRCGIRDIRNDESLRPAALSHNLRPPFGLYTIITMHQGVLLFGNHGNMRSSLL